MLPFEFVVEGPPVSQQTRRRDRLPPWRDAVRSAAALLWSADDAPVEQDVTVEMTHFFIGAPGDVDNFPKPVLDALEGLVFLDDRQVSELVTRKASQGTLQNSRHICRTG
jgi:Holliday junction resolvase RusA-like endonuclease